MKLYLFTLIAFLFTTCELQKKDDGFIYVYNVNGVNLDDAEMNAKRKILEKGLGETVEGETTVIDAEMKEQILNTSVEGIVYEYSQIGPDRKKDYNVVIDAKGKVNKKSIKDALTELMKRKGSPNFLMLVEERVNGKLNDGVVTATENAFVATYKELNFLDRNQFLRILQKEGGKTIGVYGNPKEEEKALLAAAEMDAQILLIGKTDAKNIGEVDGTSGLFSNQATLVYKIVDVGSGQIIAANNSTAAYPHVSPESGAQEAISRAVQKSHESVVNQIISKLSSGMVIRVVIEGMKYDDYLDKDISGIVRKIKGVNAVSDKSSNNANGSIVMEVKALFNGTILYRKLRDRRSDMGVDFDQKEVKPGSIVLKIKK
ncbi:MAG: hypothetical protein SFU98_01510 [Leptospiraceae bacterium]|nr:hypothetical protein [Leptospiraceae bacterium]